MLIYLDGPEKAGKTTLANEILKGFEPNRREYVKNDGRDPVDGLGYLEKFASDIESKDIQVWDRGWVSEHVYGLMLNQDRWLTDYPFAAEWIYGRPMVGRGGRFILIPNHVSQTEERRDATDLDVPPLMERRLFLDYGRRYGYEVLTNDYDFSSLRENTVIGRSSVKNNHKFSSTDYVGPIDPDVIFIEESSEMMVAKMPLLNLKAAKYFSQFGETALNKFGYATYESFNNLTAAMKKKCIAVGDTAQFWLPSLPKTTSIRKEPTKESMALFRKSAEKAIWRVRSGNLS